MLGLSTLIILWALSKILQMNSNLNANTNLLIDKNSEAAVTDQSLGQEISTGKDEKHEAQMNQLLSISNIRTVISQLGGVIFNLIFVSL